MKYILAILCVLVGLSAFGISMMAKTSIHEIYGGILWLISSVLFIGASIVSAIDAAKDRIVEALKLRETSVEAPVSN